MEEQTKEYFISKINNKQWYMVYKSGANGQTFYKLLITQKDYQGNVKNYYKNVSFKKSLTPPNDKEKIRIKQAIENYYGDDIYNPKSSIMILDFELKQTQEQKESQAFDEYSQAMADFEDVDIDENFLD